MDKRTQPIEPISLGDDRFWKRIPESCGIYFIYGYNNKLSIKITRVLDIDKDGVLYIGKSMPPTYWNCEQAMGKLGTVGA